MKVGNDITVEENMIIIYSNARVGFVSSAIHSLSDFSA